MRPNVKPVNEKTFADKLAKVNPHACWQLSTYKTVKYTDDSNYCDQMNIVRVLKFYLDHVNLHSEEVKCELKAEIEKINISHADILKIERKKQEILCGRKQEKIY